jgi:hypothetical protein
MKVQDLHDALDQANLGQDLDFSSGGRNLELHPRKLASQERWVQHQPPF